MPFIRGSTLSIEWNLQIMDKFVPVELSLIERCPLYGGQTIQYIAWDCIEVSYIENAKVPL